MNKKATYKVLLLVDIAEEALHSAVKAKSLFDIVESAVIVRVDDMCVQLAVPVEIGAIAMENELQIDGRFLPRH